MTNKLVVNINSLKVPKINYIYIYIWNEIPCTKLQLPPELVTNDYSPPNPRSLCPLSSTEFVEPPHMPRTKFLGTPLLITAAILLTSVAQTSLLEKMLAGVLLIGLHRAGRWLFRVHWQRSASELNGMRLAKFWAGTDWTILTAGVEPDISRAHCLSLYWVCYFIFSCIQWRTQEFFGGWGCSTSSVEDRGQTEQGSGGGKTLVRGSGCSCNLVQEISFHIVKCS